MDFGVPIRSHSKIEELPMKNKKVILAVSLLMLTLAPMSLSAGTKLALLPTSGTVYVDGPVFSLNLDAFCNATPCNLSWQVVLSNDGVGSINNQTGPVTTFTAGGVAGTAIVIVRDDQGHMAFCHITVL
jgi:hypothetical protein